MKKLIENMVGALADILGGGASIYLTGSTVMGDFRPGWSDIDLFAFTQGEVPGTDELLNLRQILAEKFADRSYLLFEGAIIPQNGTTAVYWGSSGQRLVEGFSLSPFETLALLDYGVLLHGNDTRRMLKRPSPNEIRAAVREEYETIRKHALPRESIYSAGWLLTAARCLYTLKTGKIASKTEAGRWALSEGLAPDREAMERVLEIRSAPEKYRSDAKTLRYIASLGNEIQRFADLIEAELN